MATRPESSSRNKSLRTQLLGAFVVALFLIPSAQRGFAESENLFPNTTIRGELSELRELPAALQAHGCNEKGCVSSISPIHLSVSVKGYPSLQVVFTEAEDTRRIRREDGYQSVNDISERPVLLRGVGYRRHLSGEHGRNEFPIAGTIYRDGGRLQLEIALTHVNRYDSSRVIVARALLGSSSTGSVARGRAVHPSSHAFASTTCGTTPHGRSEQAHLRTEQRASVSQQGTSKVLYLGTHFDRQFMRVLKCKTASKCNNRILSMINQASVYYTRQLGTRLNVARQYGPVTFTSGTSSSEGMIDNYEVYLESLHSGHLHDGTNAGSKLVDGFAAFTGQKMASNVIGIATIGAYCDNSRSLSATMVIRHTSDSVNPTTIAHELGHNLDAVHTATGIMAASVSKSGKKPRFTRESVSQISNYLEAWYSECRAGVNYTPPPGSDGSPSTIEFSVSRTAEYNFSMEFSVSRTRANCEVVVRAAETANGVNSGTSILRREMEGSGMGSMADLGVAINASSASEATVYLKAFYVCSGEVKASSPVASYVANYGPPYDILVSRAEWIQYVADVFA
jgi:hypothetical protein